MKRTTVLSILLASALLITGCGEDEPTPEMIQAQQIQELQRQNQQLQVQQQAFYQQQQGVQPESSQVPTAPPIYQQPQVVQSAPPVIVQSAPTNSDGSMMEGALLGGILGHAIGSNNNGGGYNGGYNNGGYGGNNGGYSSSKKIVNNTTIINNTSKPVTPIAKTAPIPFTKPTLPLSSRYPAIAAKSATPNWYNSNSKTTTPSYKPSTSSLSRSTSSYKPSRSFSSRRR